MNTAKERRFYVAICRNYWGVGLNIKQAKQRALMAGAGRNAKFLIKLMPPGAINIGVNAIGDIVWEWSEDTSMDDRKVRPIKIDEG